MAGSPRPGRSASGGPWPEAPDAPRPSIRGAAARGILTPMVEPRYRWTFGPTVTPSESALVAANERGLSARLAGLLAARGVTDREGIVAWFAEPHVGLHDPRLLPDADIALERLRVARERRERVQVFGDFDADGLTGLAILTLALRRF